MSYLSCPKCHQSEQQIKDGFTPARSQRYRCKICGCRYTPWSKERGYDEEVRLQALRLHLEGMSLRAISRILDVNHQTAANWINDYANHLPLSLPDSILELVELDELLGSALTPRN
jgi:transposase-like protein